MSQSETNPFLKFGNMLAGAKSAYNEGKNRIIDVKQDDGKMHCVVRFTSSNLAVSKGTVAIYMIRDLGFLMRRLGFNNKQLKKKFACTEPDCYYVSSIFGIANHLHVRHKIAVSECGKIVLALQNDTRPLPKGFHYFKLHWQKRLEKMAYFFRN